MLRIKFQWERAAKVAFFKPVASLVIAPTVSAITSQSRLVGTNPTSVSASAI